MEKVGEKADDARHPAQSKTSSPRPGKNCTFDDEKNKNKTYRPNMGKVLYLLVNAAAALQDAFVYTHMCAITPLTPMGFGRVVLAERLRERGGKKGFSWLKCVLTTMMRRTGVSAG